MHEIHKQLLVAFEKIIPHKIEPCMVGEIIDLLVIIPVQVVKGL